MKLKSKTIRKFKNIYDSCGSIIETIEIFEYYEDMDKGE